MSAAPAPRGPHPCLGRDCGHPETDHWSTPELAGPFELVVWCAVCQRHEVHRARGRRRAVLARDRPKRLSFFGRPN